MDRLRAMDIFVQVVERKSFARAAAALGLSPALVSTRIGELEQHLGVRLLDRTTRRVAITDDGEAYYGHCLRVLADVAETERVLAHGREVPQGRLRVDLPAGLGNVFIVPLVPLFLQRYPDIRLELYLSDRGREFDDTGFDVILRAGPVDESVLIAHRLADLRSIRVAAPAYLARAGHPAKPEDLRAHACLSTVGGQQRPDDAWPFARGGRRFELKVPLRYVVNTGDALARAAVEGLGIARISELLVSRYLADGRLVRVLPAWDPPETTPLSILYSRNRRLSPKVRAFVDFVRTEAQWTSPARGENDPRVGTGTGRSSLGQ